MIFLKCKIRFIYVGFNCKRKKWGKKMSGNFAIKGGGRTPNGKCHLKGTQDPGQRLSTPVQFFKLWSHWSKNDGSNLGSHWWKYCLRICAKPNIWNNNNVRNWTFIVLQGVIRAVDQGKGSHQQAQPLPEVRVFYLAYLQKHLFALWMGSGEAQIWRWSEWDLGTWGLGSHESGEDEA